MAPSALARYDTEKVSAKDLSGDSAVAELRPQAAHRGGFAVSGGGMSASAFGGTGRPKVADTKRRTALFLAHCATGASIDEACELSRMNAMRALRMVSDRDEFDRLVEQVRASGVAEAIIIGAEPSEVAA